VNNSAKYVKMWVSSCLGWISSDSVVSSTYLWRGQPVERSSMSTRKASGPNHEPWGIAPVRFLNVHVDTELLTRTRCWRLVK